MKNILQGVLAWAFVLAFFTAVISALAAPIIAIEAWSCQAKWGKSRFPVSYGPVKGCTIQMSDGRWIPENRYREVSQ